MGIVRMGVPEELVLFMQCAFNLNVFVETGTFRGLTASWAAHHFRDVFTIELSRELFDETVKEFRHLHNVHFRYGDSSTELENIVRHLEGPAVFWLDAHHCSLTTAGKGGRAPILEELDVIGASSHDHFVLIDDARLFLAPPPDPHHLDEYPDISTLLNRVNRRKNHFILIYEDVIVCVPELAREIVSTFCKKEMTRIDREFWAAKADAGQKSLFDSFVPRFKKIILNVAGQLSRISDQWGMWKRFQSDYAEFAALNAGSRRIPCRWEDRYPCLDDATEHTTYDRHYVLHPAWALRVLLQTKPACHVDIASSLRFVVQLACLMPVRHYDYRVPQLDLDNLACGQADLTHLPFQDDGISSLSCMHALEHVGLGRYGDPLDSEGDVKAARELARVLGPGGNLLVVVPVGRSRVEFNAHRIYAYHQVLDLFPSLRLRQYALIPDAHASGDLLYGASEDLTDSQQHGCGCFWFDKVAR